MYEDNLIITNSQIKIDTHSIFLNPEKRFTNWNLHKKKQKKRLFWIISFFFALIFTIKLTYIQT